MKERSYVAGQSGEFWPSCDKYQNCRVSCPIPALREAPTRRTSALVMTNRQRRVHDHRIKEQIVLSRNWTRCTSAVGPMFPRGWHGSGKKPDRDESKRIARRFAPAIRSPATRNWRHEVCGGRRYARKVQRARLRSFVANITRAHVLLRSEGAQASGEIESALREAQALVEETGGRSQEPFIHEALAELARLTGDQATCQRELREAHRLFTELGATGHAERLAKELS